jgi:protein gp37
MIDVSKGRWWDDPLQLTGGCSPASTGCLHCWSAAGAYIRQFQKSSKIRDQYEGLTYLRDGVATFNGKVITFPERLSIPLKRRKPTVYAVWNDLFHEAVPYAFIDQAVSAASLTPQHIFLILTKRPSVMADFYRVYQQKYGPPPPKPFPNIYHGLTVCNQQEWDKKGPIFMQIPGLKFISHEPALERINYGPNFKEIACLISGGETGSGARPSHPDIFRADRDQCAAAGVDFFFKGWGEWMHESHNDFASGPAAGLSSRNAMYHTWPDLTRSYRVGKGRAGRLLDGRTHDALPWVKNN